MGSSWRQNNSAFSTGHLFFQELRRSVVLTGGLSSQRGLFWLPAVFGEQCFLVFFSLGSLFLYFYIFYFNSGRIVSADCGGKFYINLTQVDIWEEATSTEKNILTTLAFGQACGALFVLFCFVD